MVCLLGLLALAASSSWLFWPLWAAAWMSFVLWVGCLAVTLMKGKLVTAAVDFFVFGFLAFIAAIRLAKPRSLWARRFYSPIKLHRSLERFAPEDAPILAPTLQKS